MSYDPIAEAEAYLMLAAPAPVDSVVLQCPTCGRMREVETKRTASYTCAGSPRTGILHPPAEMIEKR